MATTRSPARGNKANGQIQYITKQTQKTIVHQSSERPSVIDIPTMETMPATNAIPRIQPTISFLKLDAEDVGWQNKTVLAFER